MQKMSSCLWFNDQAEEAAHFYVSIFDNARILSTARYPEGGPGVAGSVMTVQFTINGEEFLALNGDSQFAFTPAISLVVRCDTQEEIDDLWEKLLQGGQEVACGWLTDRYGVSWQIVPAVMDQMLTSDDAAAAQHAFAAMMGMKKLDIAALRQAYQGIDAADEAAA
jgi:predicted 3-demethylubiquinone-9 3-methyltransferase (glyoxalase superfamily)